MRRPSATRSSRKLAGGRSFLGEPRPLREAPGVRFAWIAAEKAEYTIAECCRALRVSDNNPAYRIVASPVTFGDIVIAPTRERPMLVLRAGGRGNVTTSHKLYEFNNGPDVPTPVTDGKYLYVVNDPGIAYCMELQTGKPVYGPERLTPGTYSASPVLADGKIYITSEDGITSVYRAGPKFGLLAENKMDDYTLSSIAVKDGQLFLRTAGWLWVIGQKAG